MKPSARDFEFTIASKVYGEHIVVAPARFRGQIESLSWHLKMHLTRGRGHQLSVATTTGRDATGRQKTIYLHRMIWIWAGNTPARIIDHADRNPLNNSEMNLRAATAADSARNTGIRKHNTSGYIGVIRRGKKWRAMIRANRKDVWLGTFDNARAAVIARDEAARRYHGEFAALNSDVPS